MNKQDRLYPPYLRSSLNYEQGLEQSGYYRKRGKSSNTFYLVWLIVVAVAALALMMTTHRNEVEMTDQVNRSEVIRRMSTLEDINRGWAQRELFIMRQARNSAAVLDQYYRSNK